MRVPNITSMNHEYIDDPKFYYIFKTTKVQQILFGLWQQYHITSMTAEHSCIQAARAEEGQKGKSS